MRTSRSANRPASGATRRRGVATACAVVISLVAMTAVQVATPAARAASVDTGFTQPFAGTPGYLPLAPPKLDSTSPLHEPIGQARADEIALALGLDEADAFTPEQFAAFVSGGGVGGDPAQAKLVDLSALILTNTVGRPLLSDIGGQVTPSVLASYGLYVNEAGTLMSPANTDAPTRQVNSVIAPGGYLGTWCRANGCEATVDALYASGYRDEVVYGLFSQQISGVAQLVPNSKDGVSSQVGMSMAPSIWLTNFALLYMLKPELGAAMPAAWAPIPPAVAEAILASPTGQVPYCEHAAQLGAEPVPCPTPAPSPTPPPTATPVPSPPTTAPAVPDPTSVGAVAVVAAPSFTG